MSYNHNASWKVNDSTTQNILFGEWGPGNKIRSENELCSYLGVSRIAVRDAIASLTAISVLRRVRGSGIYVKILDNASPEGTKYFMLNTEDVLELMGFRIIIESYRTEFFTERATSEEIQALEDSYYNMLKYHNGEKKDYYSDRFHHLIALDSKNKFIIKIMNHLNENMLDHQKLSSKGSRRQNYQNGVTYHYKMFQAIKSNDKEMADVYCRYHIRLGMELYHNALERKKDEIGNCEIRF